MITFNSIAASTFADIVSIQRISRPASPGSRARLLEITGREGVYYFGKDGRTQTVDFRLTLNSSSIANRRIAIRQIAAWLETDDVAVLSFSDEPTIIYYAVLTDAIPAEEFATVGFLDVSFLIPDGCAYSSTIEEVTTASGDCTFNNEGTKTTPVIIEATINEASVVELKLALTDANYITFEYAFTTADIVIVNTFTGEATINAVDASEYITIGSNPFLRLPVGGGKITPTPTSTPLTLKFRERFI